MLAGLAKDGGLFLPETIPTLPENWHEDWAGMSYCELALEILSLFISADEVPRNELKELVDRSYSTFRHPDVAPLVRTGEKEYILELFHGQFPLQSLAIECEMN